MKLNYFAFVCFLWAFIGLSTRIMMLKMGQQWKDWEVNTAYAEKKPKFLSFLHIVVILFIAYTWYMVYATNIPWSWVIALLLSSVMVKALIQVYKYDQFREFVKKAMSDKKLFRAINTLVTLLSFALIALGVFYMQ